MLELIGDGAQMGFWWIMDHLLFINIFLSILIIFFSEKNPMTVWAWLLILYFIPVLASVCICFWDRTSEKTECLR